MRKFWNGIVGFAFGVTLLLGAPAVDVAAAEYTVSPAAAILYTNENTVILADADAAGGSSDPGDRRHEQRVLSDQLGRADILYPWNRSECGGYGGRSDEPDLRDDHGAKGSLSGGHEMDERELLWLERRNLHWRLWLCRVCVCGKRCGIRRY